MLTFVSISVDQSAFIATLSAVLTVILVAFFVIAHTIVNLLQLSTLFLLLIRLRRYCCSLERLRLDSGNHLLDVVVILRRVAWGGRWPGLFWRRHRVMEARSCCLWSWWCCAE